MTKFAGRRKPRHKAARLKGPDLAWTCGCRVIVGYHGSFLRLACCGQHRDLPGPCFTHEHPAAVQWAASRPPTKDTVALAGWPYDARQQKGVAMFRRKVKPKC